MEDVSYRTLSKLNQSLLKEILISPKAFLDAKARYESPKESTEEYFVFGSMVDIMLTGTKKEFDEKFYRIPDDIKCTDSIKTVVTEVYNEVRENDLSSLETYRDEILKHCKYQGYQNNWKDDTRIDKVIEQGSDYFNILAESEGKIKITDTEYSNALACKMALQADEFTKVFVDRKLDKNVEFLDKVIIEFDVDGIDLKGELDRVVINHNTKTVCPLDFKTTSKPVYSFESSFWFFRYDFQAATYMAGILKHPIIEDLIEKQGYKLDPFRFIVVEKDLRNNPLIFQVGNQALQIGYMGGELSSGKTLEGLLQAIARYQYAEENNRWQYPMEYYQNQGNIFIEP